MKKIILLGLLFCVHNIQAQKIQIEEIDRFTGHRIIETSKVKIATPKSDFKIRVEHDCVKINVQLWNISGLNEACIEADNSELLIITNDEELYRFQKGIINWENIEKHSSVHWGAGISTGTSTKLKNINLNFYIDTDAIKRLNDSIIDDLRIIIGDFEINFDKLDSYEKKSISKLFKLVTQKL